MRSWIPWKEEEFPRTKQHFPPQGGHITLRNDGTNTVWIAWEHGDRFHIPCGTSYECDQETCSMFAWTQTGRTRLLINFIPWM